MLLTNNVLKLNLYLPKKRVDSIDTHFIVDRLRKTAPDPRADIFLYRTIESFVDVLRANDNKECRSDLTLDFVNQGFTTCFHPNTDILQIDLFANKEIKEEYSADETKVDQYGRGSYKHQFDLEQHATIIVVKQEVAFIKPFSRLTVIKKA